MIAVLTFLVLLIFPIFVGNTSLLAQEEERTHASYTIAAESALGSGDFTAYQLVANQFDVLSHQANTGYLRAAVDIDKKLGENWQLSGAIDLVLSAHAKRTAYLQQLYANLSYKDFYLELGSREHAPVLRNQLLSSGSLINSGNSKPIPEVRIGTLDFYVVPGTKNWLQVYFDASYGVFMDDDWLISQYEAFQSRQGNRHYLTTDVWYHQKKLYLRTDNTRPFVFTVGIEHAVQFGGKCHDYYNGEKRITDLSPSFKDFITVILPRGDGNVGSTVNKTKEWVKGNHLGELSFQLSYNIHSQKNINAYLEVPFEDGSGIRKGNGMDGLWGIEYNDRNSEITPLRSIVFEYLQTTDQSGPIHWAPDDFSASGEWHPEQATGNDNYYNNYFYNGYCHYGQSLGSPLLMSPVYNRDAYLGFIDNRVKVWHVGVMGDISSRFNYMFRSSYREGYGTYFVPLQNKHHSFDMMCQLGYRQGPWICSAAIASSSGNIYGDCYSVDFKVMYHGKIF